MVQSRQQLFIHSGAYKTATSAVQIALNNNAAALRRDYGILVPQTFARPLQGVEGAGARSHNQLGHAVNKYTRGDSGARERLLAGLAILADEVREAGLPRAVLSAEMLTGIDAGAAALIRDALQEFDLRIIYTVRRPDEYLESLARQRLKFKNSANKVQPPYTTPFQGLLSWAEVLGDSSVEVFVYGYPSRADSVLNVLRAVGIADPERLVDEQAILNPSLHADGLLLRKALTRFATKVGFDVVRGALREVIVRRAYQREARLDSQKPLQMYSKAELLAIFDATRAVHENIAARFLGPAESALFLSRAAIEAQGETEPPRWGQAEVIAIVDELARFARDHLRASKPHNEALSELQGELHKAREHNRKLKRRLRRLAARLETDQAPGDGEER